MTSANVQGAIDDIARGRMVILVDDEDRENEGDLCMAAEQVTPEAVNFMATYARGLICLTLTEEKTEALRLPMMVERNTSAFQTGFTVSIEARQGVSTGISAADRAHTILTAVRDDASPDDLVTPGHVFPIRARKGGVLVRTGQTEGSVDLARLAGLRSAGVICEIMNEDGSMARRPDLERFAETHGLRIVTIAELIEYRLAHEALVDVVADRELQTPAWGDVRAVVLKSQADQQEHLALVKGQISEDRPTLVRVQSIDLPADLVTLALTGGGPELQAAFRVIADAGEGVFVYLCRTDTPLRMSEKLDRLEASDPARRYHRVGSRLDLREFGTGAQILRKLGVRKFRLLTNREFRIVGLEGYGLELVDRVELPIDGKVQDRQQGGTP
ncbi:MAG TPA: 3,4-dihydroxy-2-butanone-4-phosphate synthase [Myxococcales bacterium LLY-WYZ-16_1]|nr:3,4-dihydroxy-2-butanone-4-phosphate synthase [Myxococcales bacterium LLY-WYZ-16_1]